MQEYVQEKRHSRDPTRVSDASMAKLTGLATLITVAKNAVSR